MASRLWSLTREHGRIQLACGEISRLQARQAAVEVALAIGVVERADARWRDALKDGQDCFFIEKLRQEVDITKPSYTTRYPELVGYLDPPAGVPRVTHTRLNLLVRCGRVSGGI